MSAADKSTTRTALWPARITIADERSTLSRNRPLALIPTPAANRQIVTPGGGLQGPSRCQPRRTGMDSDAVRKAMVDRLRQLWPCDERVLQALQAVPRHHFVDPGLAAQAYSDNALPIGFGQTISKPSVVARSLDAALKAISPRGDLGKMLDIGTGCGYAAAVAARLAVEVYSVERIRALHDLARRNLRALRVPNLRLILGDGMLGYAAAAPFDVIVSAAATPTVPQSWLDQLAVGGVLVAPIGEPQQLLLYRKRAAARFDVRPIESARFVPLKSGLT